MAFLEMEFDDAITTATLTARTGCTISGDSSCVKNGHVVCANLAFTLNGTFAYRATLISGLPKPSREIYAANSYQASGGDIAFDISTSGKLEIRNAATYSSRYCVINVTYISPE